MVATITRAALQGFTDRVGTRQLAARVNGSSLVHRLGSPSPVGCRDKVRNKQRCEDHEHRSPHQNIND